MQLWQNLLFVGLGLIAVALVTMAPGRLGRVLMMMCLNLLSGLAVLAAVNVLAVQLFVPLNLFSAVVSCVLGAPGVAVLAVLAAL